jgi:hypothetical protein
VIRYGFDGVATEERVVVGAVDAAAAEGELVAVVAVVDALATPRK